jgi:hypothetical protein
MANLFDLHAQGLLRPLMGATNLNLGVTNTADVGAAIGRNMDRPVSAGTALTNIWGTPDEFLLQYKNFNNIYQQMIQEELSAPGISEVKRRMLMVHQSTPSINLRILSYKNQQQLKEVFRGSGLLNIDGLFSQFGAPGFLFPSDNQYRLGGKMLTDKSMGAHPFLSLLDTLNFSIDPFATSLKGVDVGYSNLPSFEALDSMYRQGSDLSGVIQQIQSTKRAAKLFVYDTETSGFGLFSQVRNLGAVSSELDIDMAGNLKFGPMSVATSAHIASSEMSDMTAIKRVGGVETKVNYAQYAFEKERLNNLEELFDLSTKDGRQKAANAYKNFFSKALEHDYIVGHNIQFDIQRVMMSAGLIEEFATDKDALKLMADFSGMIKQGKVINTLDLLRGSQMQQAMEAAKAAGLTGADGQKFAEKLIGTVYSDKALGKMGFSNVAPASIENALLSSNLIDLIEGSGPEGSDLVRKLASRAGTHESITDAKLTQYILRFVQSGDLRWGVPNTNPLAHKAAMNAMKSSSFITLTRFSDVEGMTNATLKYVQSNEGMEGVKLYDETRNETIYYNKKKKEWTSARVSTDGSTVETRLGEAATRNRILAAIDASEKGLDSELVDLGVGFQQQSRAISMLDNVGSIVNNISTTVGSNAGRVRSTAAGLTAANDAALDNAFLRALGSTQEEIGFNFYYDSQNLPEAMRQAMNEPGSQIGDARKAAYVQRLAEGGLANSMLDPSIRRTAVEVARATSLVPHSDDIMMARRQITKRLTADVAAGTMQQSELDLITALSDVDFSAKYGSQISIFNSQMKNVSRAASELGVSFLRSQKAVSTITKTGGMSVTVAPTEMLKKIKVTIDGNQVDFLSEEFLKDRRYNKFNLSIAQDQNKKFANLILDQDVIDRTMAEELAKGYLDQIQEAIDLGDDKKLLDDGLFSSQQQINEYRTILSVQESKDKFLDDLAINIEERGIGVAGVGGEVGKDDYRVATALETIIKEKGQGIGNQTKATEEGMQFELTRIDENLAEMQIRIQDEEIGIVRAADAGLADYLENTGSGGMRETVTAQRDALMERAAEDSKFAKRIATEEATRTNKPKGLLYRLLGRSSRDAELIDAYRRLKPKIGYGALAVGALGAGYYINEKRKENDLYDETIEQQPYEKTNFVSEQNSGFTQINSPISSRRDPLATAGVVGTLDRNKIGHTQMGPNKYNHLYGR